jgi:glycosyltransferase involved in cell wall biosynthesis
MSAQLNRIYQKVNPGFSDLFVVPLIPFDYPKSSYLYRLYAEFIEGDESKLAIKLHSISVFAHWKFVTAAFFRKKTILHYHWLEFQDSRALSAMLWKLFCIWAYHLAGGKIVWTVHNLKPHDRQFLRLHRTIARWMGKKATVILVHCQSCIPPVSDYYGIPEQKIEVLPHPAFPTEKLDKAESRKKMAEKLGIAIPEGVFVYLVFGQISHYKGIPEIIDKFRELNRSDVHLIVAGTVKKGNQALHEELIMFCSKVPGLYLRDSFLDEESVALLHNAADACVFNHRDIMASGSVEMALSYKLPIITPKQGCICDYADEHTHFFETQAELLEQMSKLAEGKAS